MLSFLWQLKRRKKGRRPPASRQLSDPIAHRPIHLRMHSYVSANMQAKPIQVLNSSWHGRPFGHNRLGRKVGELLCPFLGVAGSPSNTMCQGGGLRPCQVSSWSIQSFGHNTPASQTDNGPIAYRANRFTNGRPENWPGRVSANTNIATQLIQFQFCM